MRGFFRQFLAELKVAMQDKGVLMLWLLAPLAYAFFYPWPYSREVVQQVPVAVVDADQSSLSRQIIRYTSASPQLEIHVLPSESAAQHALWRGEIAGYALIPKDLKRDVSRGRPAAIAILGNGSYIMLNKTVLTGFASAVGTVSAGIEIRKLQAAGISARQANIIREPVTLAAAPLFNRNEGYGSSLVPAVAVLILQQTLLMATAMFSATLRERHALNANAGQWLARICALALPSALVGLFFFGWLFWLQGYAHGGNLIGSLLLLPPFTLAIAAYGCLVGLLLGERERVLYLLLASSLPLFFLSGYAWPANALPEPLQYLRWLSPSTPAIHGSVLLNQMGANARDVIDYLATLALQAITAFVLLCLAAKKQAVNPKNT